MGIVNFGIPIDSVTRINEILQIDIFFEEGTYLGGTAAQMSNMFKKVITVEASEAMHAKAMSSIGHISNIQLIKGDTREALSDEKRLVTQDTFFWLDAHWSGGETYGEDDECPLLEELNSIFKNKTFNHAILIDDARLFMAPPPHPHISLNWPSLANILNIIPSKYALYVWNDVIYILPRTDKISTLMQDMITEEWRKHGKNKRSKINQVKRLVRKLLAAK
ncbi:hypothetical protein KBY57_00015 [Cyanobium sp. Aljojuca 7D2]|uniref:hypothetical protein n=1 Tax=Cyanobium sp. Aljojuca 7D2 TaxID=2823698 RepID=UPI0020CD9EE6|nr:hypothetical protein [Cyanobium sp. Aljojuca 7D2]MCP9889442.1 hypothetical protein [Cyanobium sp. Aljojuca 7D2]